MAKVLLISSTIILFFLTTSCKTREEAVYEWRGLERSGHYNETGLLNEWPSDGPEMLWSIDNLGNGYGSPVFAGEHIFITGERDSMSILYCFTLKGELVWESTLGREWTRSYRGGRDAPTVVGNLIYSGTALGDLYCVRRENGEVVWSADFEDHIKGALPIHGFSEAPLIDGNMVFRTAGGKENNVVALDRFTGEIIWTNPGFGEPQGYNQPKLIRLPERNIVVTFSAYHLMGLDAATGELLWWHEQDNLPVERRRPGYGDTHSNTVLHEGSHIWYVAGDGNGAVKLELSAGGSSVKEIWRSRGLSGYMGGIVKLGDYIYGDAQERPGLKSINAITGERTDSLRTGEGITIAADNMLYFYSTRGEMILVKSDNGKLEQISSFRIIRGTNEHFSHPVIYRGILYVRRGESLMAIDIKAS